MEKSYINFIKKFQRLDGGFPYRKQGGSVVESTVFSTLAIFGDDKNSNVIPKAINYLKSLQTDNGGWLLFEDDNLSSAYATALSLITLKTVDSVKFASEIKKGIYYLQHYHKFFTNKYVDEEVWGWNDGTFMTPEPTAMAILALKMNYVKDDFNIQQAEQFFAHNRCLDGGWTYGHQIDNNAPDSTSRICTVLDPQLNISAIVLLSMLDKKNDFVDQLSVLERIYQKSFCPLSLSYATLALNAYGKDTSKIIERLNYVMKTDNYAANMVIYNALSALANLTQKGFNPLCLKK